MKSFAVRRSRDGRMRGMFDIVEREHVRTWITPIPGPMG